MLGWRSGPGGKGAGRRPAGGRSWSRELASGQGHGLSHPPHPLLPAGPLAASPWVPARRPGDPSRGHDGPQEEAAAPERAHDSGAALQGAWPPRGLGAPLASGPPCPHPPGRPEPWTGSVPPCLSPLDLQTQRSFSLGSKQLASESRSVVSDSLRPGSHGIFSRPEYWRGQLFPLA